MPLICILYACYKLLCDQGEGGGGKWNLVGWDDELFSALEKRILYMYVLQDISHLPFITHIIDIPLLQSSQWITICCERHQEEMCIQFIRL